MTLDEMAQFLQIPLVLAFMFFTLKMLERFDSMISKRDASWQDFLARIEQRNRDFIAEQSRSFLASLAEMRASFENTVRELSEDHCDLRRMLENVLEKLNVEVGRRMKDRDGAN